MINEEEFRKRTIVKFGDIFDLSEVIYKKFLGNESEIKICCPQHGWFEKTPQNFLYSKYGCSECAKEAVNQNNFFSEIEFNNKVKLKFGDKFDLSRSNYKNMMSHKINIYCSKHGWFSKTPFNFLQSEHGCSDCAREEITTRQIKKSSDKFEEKAKVIHGEACDYSETIYTGVYEKVKLFCNICKKSFSIMANSHLNGHGCYHCSRGGFDPNKPAILYYLKHTESGYYKSGITNRTLKDRFGPKLKEVKIINIKDFDLGKDAYLEEQEILKKYDKHRIRFDEFGTGVTEFFNKDVLRLDS